MKVKNKLVYVVCALMLALMLQFAGFHHIFLKSHRAASSSALFVNSAHHLNGLSSRLEVVHEQISSYILTQNHFFLDQITLHLDAAEQAALDLSAVEGLASSRGGSVSLQTYYVTKKSTEESLEIVSRLQHEILTKSKNIDWETYQSQFEVLRKKLSITNSSVLDKALGIQEQMSASYDSSINFSIIILLLALLVAMGASGIIRFQIVGSVEKLCKGLQQMREQGAGGHMEVWSNDEFSEIVHAVNDLSQNLQESTVSRQYLNDILDSMQESLLVVDSSDIILSQNATIANFLDSPLDGETLMHFFKRILTAPDQITQLIKNDEEGVQIESELKSEDENGNSQYVSISWRKFQKPNSSKNENLSLITMVDITERKKLESQLLHAQKIDAIGQLAGGVAHDFNNLLAGIAGSVYLLKRGLKQDEKSLSQLDMISDCVRLSSDLTKKLLGFARKAKVEIGNVSIVDAFEQAIGIIDKTMSKDISFESYVPKGTWAAIADSSQLVSVLMNLAVNARDAIEGRGVIKFFASNEVVDENFLQEDLTALLPHGNYVRLSIQDNGSGIPDKIRAKIFDPFFTTKQIGSGTGLGLSMVSEIVKNHGGALKVFSQSGLGTSIDIFLPANSQVFDRRDYDLLNIKGLKSELYSSLNGLRIMLVDDEPLVRSVTTKFLEHHGCCVSTADNGEAALELFAGHEQDFDVVILDVIMPRKDGIETFEALRDNNPNLPVVFYSGYTENDRLEACTKEPGVRFISKPYLPEDFLQALMQVVH